MNLVITISRRFGTGASLIAQELSEKLGVPVYDKAYIEHELDGDSYATEAEVIKELAEHPCIILGRCASEILKDQPNVFNVYVCADKEDRIERIMKKESLPHDEAKEMLEKNDAERADYYYENNRELLFVPVPTNEAPHSIHKKRKYSSSSRVQAKYPVSNQGGTKEPSP